MSNPPPNAILLFLISVSSTGWAQSPALLEAVRVQRPNVLEVAQQELNECLGGEPKAKACPAADRLSLLTGFLLLSKSETQEAVVQLKSRRSPKGLEPFYGWYLGEALAWSNQVPAALKVWNQARSSAPDWLKNRIDARVGELLFEQGLFKKARPLLEKAATLQPIPELIYRRGIARAQTGDLVKGRADLKSLAVRHPTHEYGVRADKRIRDMYTLDDVITRASSLPSARAIEELTRATVPKGREASLELALAQAYFRANDVAKGEEQLQRAIERNSEVAASAQMIRARRLLKNGDPTAAHKAFTEIETNYPSQSIAEEAGYLAAWLSLQADDFQGAAEEFQQFETRHPRSKKRDEARWFRAYALQRAKKCDAAVLQSLISDFPQSSLVPQARYWRAVCQLQGQSQADAGVTTTTVVKDLSQVVVENPGSFYAALASQRLAELGQTPPSPFEAEPEFPEVEVPKRLQLAQRLAEVGLMGDLKAEVDEAVRMVKSPEDALVWAHALIHFGDYGTAYALGARRLWGAAYTQRKPEAIAVLYPKAYAEAVESMSQAEGLDPFFAWAIMRQESAFRPSVTSSADARGLMQLIPPTAERIAQVRKLPTPDPSELYVPAQNVELGTWLLRRLLDRFGHPALSAAAYNAGTTPVLKWVSSRQQLPLDEWVEAIPWKETRGYVKNVISNYYVYRCLYGKAGEPFAVSLKLPTPKPEGENF